MLCCALLFYCSLIITVLTHSLITTFCFKLTQDSLPVDTLLILSYKIRVLPLVWAFPHFTDRNDWPCICFTRSLLFCFMSHTACKFIHINKSHLVSSRLVSSRLVSSRLVSSRLVAVVDPENINFYSMCIILKVLNWMDEKSISGKRRGNHI